MKKILFAMLILVQPCVSMAQVDDAPWRLESIWTIGGEESETYFTYVDLVQRSSTGRLYVHNGRDPFVQIFDSNGSELEQLGREGQGPGEFSEVTSILPLPNGNVFIQDRRGGRISEFDSKDKLLRTIVIPEVSTRIMRLLAYDQDKDLLAFLAQTGKGPEDLKPLLFIADLQNLTVDAGRMTPGDLLDLRDEIYAFSANSIISYNSDFFCCR